MLLVPTTTSFWWFNFFSAGRPYWKLKFPNHRAMQRWSRKYKKNEVRPLVCASASSACLSGRSRLNRTHP